MNDPDIDQAILRVQAGSLEDFHFVVAARTYRVQYNGNLSAKDWTDLAGDVSATGTTASKTDTIAGGASQRFYRVLLLP